MPDTSPTILASDSRAWLIVGLGNPGPAYSGNRHNVGAMVVDELASRAGTALRPGRSRAGRSLVAEVRVRGAVTGAPGAPLDPPRAVLSRPLSYMNECGGAVHGLAAFYKIAAERIVVVHDELDIPFGVVRLKRGGGEGGHNGLRSISRSLGTRDYLRVRAGIGRPPGRMDPADFVLHDFPGAQREEAALLVSQAADAVELLLGEGLQGAQQRFHTS